MGQLIRGPIQTHFGPSCVHRVYFLCKSTDLHDIRMECQIINISRSFFTVLLIYHKLPVIYWYLAPVSLYNHSPIDTQSLLNRYPVCWICAVENFHCLRDCKIEHSFKDSLSWSCSLLSKWTWSLNIHQAELASPTHQTFYLLWGVHRDILIHIPPHKGNMLPTTTFIWVYFFQMDHQLHTMKTLPKC